MQRGSPAQGVAAEVVLVGVAVVAGEVSLVVRVVRLVMIVILSAFRVTKLITLIGHFKSKG